MADSVQERVGKTENRLHTLEYRVEKVEELNSRVTNAEQDIKDLSNNMIHVQERQQELRDDMRHGFNTVHGKFDQISQKIDSGFEELRAAVAEDKGKDNGISLAIKWLSGALGIAAMVMAAILWFQDVKAATPPIVAGMSAECNDGTYSQSEGRGTCSGHGGVKRWMPK